MKTQLTRDQIIDATLALASEREWEPLRLYDVAEALDATLDDIRVHFREKDELIDAWFDRADQAMLQRGTDAAFLELDFRGRLTEALFAWLERLAPHRRVARQMMAHKLEIGHIHVQFAGLLRVSRTVQWWRETAQMDAAHMWRAIEEAALTTIYLKTFSFWLFDSSTNSQKTRDFLNFQLRVAERLGNAFSGCGASQLKGATDSELTSAVTETPDEPVADSDGVVDTSSKASA
ncbi:MAG: TetR/AcrR family transcriptional regulator [Thiotrichaceae bacterium]|nr:TetR/AcrR family transcriptional regulator [Thiotrichaceae bacterium]